MVSWTAQAQKGGTPATPPFTLYHLPFTFGIARERTTAWSWSSVGGYLWHSRQAVTPALHGSRTSRLAHWNLIAELYRIGHSFSGRGYPKYRRKPALMCSMGLEGPLVIPAFSWNCLGLNRSCRLWRGTIRQQFPLSPMGVLADMKKDVMLPRSNCAFQKNSTIFCGKIRQKHPFTNAWSLNWPYLLVWFTVPAC